MPAICVRDINMYYEEEGVGLPVVCIAGLAATHEAWAPMRASLARQCRVVVFDNRGVGKTDAPDSPCSVEMMAEDTFALMDELGINDAVIMGHSMGTAIAQAMALRQPARVRKLVLCSPFERLRPYARFAFRTNARLLRAGIPAHQLFEVILPWLYSDAYLEDARQVQALLDLVATLPQQPAYAFERQLEALAAFDSAAWVAQLRPPALLLAGQEDRLVPLDDVRLMAGHMPRAELAVLPTAHLGIIEKAGECAGLVAGFISRR